MKAFFRWLLKIHGWKFTGEYPAEVKKSVMIAAPHTSNWDFYYTLIAFRAMGVPMNFTIKKEWMRFPFNLIIKPLGGVGINRQNPQGEKISVVDSLIHLLESRERLVLVVTPEGTRSRVEKWKTGFYRVAVAANVPIIFGSLDYSKKLAIIGDLYHPSGDYDKDIEEIKEFFRGVTGKHPENGVF